MKTRFIWLLVLVNSMLLSGCSRLFEVPPKTIYSPIELNAKLTPVKLSESVCKVRFIGSNPNLRYGALLFYDSLAASSFIRERKTVGRVQVVTGVRSSSAMPNEFITDTIRFDNTRGQYLYITPIAYTSEDSLAIWNRLDFNKAYSSQGYIRLKISPWTYVTDLPGPAFEKTPVLFPVGNKLFCIKYEGYFAYRSDIIYGYELDAASGQWTEKGKFQNKYCQVCVNPVPTDPSQAPTIRYITGINSAYFANNEYHLLVNTWRTGGTGLLRHGIGEVITDQNFASKALNINFEHFQSSYYSLADVQSDRAVIIRNSPTSQPTGNAYLTAGYSTTLSTNKSAFYNTKESISPSVACVVSNKLIANSSELVNTFSVYDLDDVGLKKLTTVAYADRNKLWIPTDVTNRVLSISKGDHAFLLNNLLNIYRVTLNTKNEPVFTSIYSGWFPANSATAFNQGIVIGDVLWFLVNSDELWTINPNQLTIDFTRPGAVSIVTL